MPNRPAERAYDLAAMQRRDLERRQEDGEYLRRVMRAIDAARMLAMPMPRRRP